MFGRRSRRRQWLLLHNGRFCRWSIQTAARATGVMQAAFEQALSYAQERNVFGKPIAAYSLTLVKIARMAMLLSVSRQFTYYVARLMDEGKGQMEASLVETLFLQIVGMAVAVKRCKFTVAWVTQKRPRLAATSLILAFCRYLKARKKRWHSRLLLAHWWEAAA